MKRMKLEVFQSKLQRLKLVVVHLTPSVKSGGLISTFAPIGMLDLSRTLALTPSVKWALVFCGLFYQMTAVRRL